MKTYREWSPTGHDIKGLGLEDRQNWIVAPILLTPNVATTLDESNWAAQEEWFTSLQAEHEVHRFGHWATSFKIVLVHPSFSNDVARLEERYDNYLVLDEEDWSKRQYAAAQEAWRHMSYRERKAAAERDGVPDPRRAAKRVSLPTDGRGFIVVELGG